MDTESITEFILKLDKSGSLDLNIGRQKLEDLADHYFTGREIYETYQE